MLGNTLKVIGFGVNFVLLLIFLFAAICLTSYGLSFLEAAGGMPTLTSVASAVINPITTINNVIFSLSSGTFFVISMNYIGAWVTLIAAAGAWWMTVLGLRWHYYAALRVLEAID